MIWAPCGPSMRRIGLGHVVVSTFAELYIVRCSWK